MQDEAVGTEGDAYTRCAVRGQLQDITGGGFPHDPVMGRAQLVPRSPVILVAASNQSTSGKRLRQVSCSILGLQADALAIDT